MTTVLQIVLILVVIATFVINNAKILQYEQKLAQFEANDKIMHDVFAELIRFMENVSNELKAAEQAKNKEEKDA